MTAAGHPNQGEHMSATKALPLAVKTLDVVEFVRVLIAENELVADDRLPPIRNLAVQFGVKPGTVRDALLTAQAQGFVKVLTRVGAIEKSVKDSQRSKTAAEQPGASLGNVVRQDDQNLFHILETCEALKLTMVAGDTELRTNFRAAYDNLLDEMRKPPVINRMRSEGNVS